MAAGSSSIGPKRFSNPQEYPASTQKGKRAPRDEFRAKGSSDDAFVSFQRTGRPRGEPVEYPKKRKVKDKNSEPSETSPNPPVTPTPEAPVEAAPTPISTTPTDTKPVSDPNSIKTLAQRYVAQYEKQGAKTLSDEERKNLVAEVESFYSDPSQTGRLKAFVEGTA